jgi:ATP-binding cassette, subfamily B, multidrug efflux pump
MTVPATQTHDDDILGKAYDRKLMRRLLVYTRPYRGLMYGAFALLCVEGAIQVIGPLLTRRVIDVAVPTRDMRIVVVSTALLFFVLIAEFVLTYTQTWLTSLLGQRVMRDIRMQIFEHLQRLSVSFFDRNPAGRLITRVTSDVETLNELFTAGVVSGLGDLFTLVAISVAMLIMDWRLALWSFAVIPFVVMVSGFFRKGVRNTYRDIRIRIARINSFLQERLTGMRIVQLFGQEKREAERFDELNRSHLDANLKSITIYALYFPAIELLTSVALAILIVAGASRVEANVLSVGTVAAFLQLVRRFFQPLQDLSEKYNILQTAMASSERIFTLLDTMPTVPDNAERAGVLAKKPGVEVVFEDVWFAYDVAHLAKQAHGAPQESSPVEWVLKGVSFTARPGQTLALVGHTGAGKTTIVNLLMRFYDPQRGRITINGVDIRTIPLEELRALIGYVQQDIFLFAGDIASNIRLSNPLTDQEVVLAAAEVGADRIIRGFPKGYGQVLGERGASISVGERQLLSFARAIAANAPLLLLDEATSAVDSEIEAEIHAALSVLVAGRTTIAVAHRLSTIANADMILVLHHGEVVERGIHRELIARGGLYSALWRLQAGDSEPLLQRVG